MAKITTSQAKEEIRVAAENALKLLNQATAENAKLLASAISDASKLIADQAENARKVVASQAADALKVTNLTTGGDHDTITKLVNSFENLDKKFTEKFLEIRTDIKDIKDGTSRQIADHEIRINALETSKTKQNTMMAIGIGILSILTSLLIYHLV